ncbi:hypothetical protein JOF53_000604 [Crossiella equi]|uniref:PucR family transcriptional regulator n=1 Tax=Crossiella equi TaxID=130796 RepID=A0ABS5A664_9PSEU|nr:helix-turn-helix domain-containing protein [Crossiella equi]MBP2471732.1 hypothetical protein [Crossiella equi]
MTDHNAALTVNGTVLYQWLLTERRRLAQSLTREHHELTAAVEVHLEVLAQSLRTRRTPEVEDLSGPVTATAARQAAEGRPLAEVLSAYHGALLSVWRRLVGDARPEDLPAVLDGTELVLRYLDRAAAAVTQAYLAERHRRDSDRAHYRRALFTVLLNGEPAEDLASRAGFPLPERFSVLRLAVTPAPVSPVAVQRVVYRTEEILARGLLRWDNDGATVLLPTAPPPDLPAVLAEATGAVPHLAHVPAAHPHLAAAVAQAGEVLDLVRALGRPGGLYGLADVLLEYQLTRPSPAGEELAALLDPLADHPDLLHTLETHVRLGLDRRRTGAELHLHPNTIDYRLRRAIALTGLDPADPAQLQRIGAALVIRRHRAR